MMENTLIVLFVAMISMPSLLAEAPNLPTETIALWPEATAGIDPAIPEKASKLESGKAQATFESSKPLESALLVSTTGTGHTGTRTWVETPATLKADGDKWNAEADVPAGTTACFLNVKTGSLTATSDYFEIK